MATVPGHGHLIGALYRCHSLNHDITVGSIKCPPEKQTYRYVTIILCNKMEFSFGANMAGFAETVTNVYALLCGL